MGIKGKSAWKQPPRGLLFWVGVLTAAMLALNVYWYFAGQMQQEEQIAAAVRWRFTPYYYARHGQLPRDLSELPAFQNYEWENELNVESLEPELAVVKIEEKVFSGVIQFHAWPTRRIPFLVSMDEVRRFAEIYKVKFWLKNHE